MNRYETGARRSPIRVIKRKGEWLTLCLWHGKGASVTSTTWEDAYEAAAGHAVMHHPRFTIPLSNAPSPEDVFGPFDLSHLSEPCS